MDAYAGGQLNTFTDRKGSRTVTSPRPGTVLTSEEHTSPGSKPARRRVVRLTALPIVETGTRTGTYPRADTTADVTAEPAPRPESGGAHRARRHRGFPASRDDWLVIAERVVGDWTSTLRAALLATLVVAAVLTTIGLVFGAVPALAAGGFALFVFLVGRRRGGSPHD